MEKYSLDVSLFFCFFFVFFLFFWFFLSRRYLPRVNSNIEIMFKNNSLIGNIVLCCKAVVVKVERVEITHYATNVFRIKIRDRAYFVRAY